jgi:hypothetical protein
MLTLSLVLHAATCAPIRPQPQTQLQRSSHADDTLITAITTTTARRRRRRRRRRRKVSQSRSKRALS